MDESIKFLINEDIEKYQVEVYKGLNKRQAKGAVTVVFIGVGAFLVFNLLLMIPLFLSTLMALFLCVFVAMRLFLRIEGMDLLVFLSKKWAYRFNPGYYYDADAYRRYEAILNDEIASSETEMPKKTFQPFKLKNKKKQEWIKAEDVKEGQEFYGGEENVEEYEKADLKREELPKSDPPARNRDQDLEDTASEEQTYEQEPDKYKEFLDSDENRRQLRQEFPSEKIAWLFGKETESPPRQTVLNDQPQRSTAQEKIEGYEDFPAGQNESTEEDTGSTMEAEPGDTMLLEDGEPSYRFVLVEVKTGKKNIITDGFRVGRRTDFADLLLKNKTVSGKHAEIHIKGDSVLLMDKGSRNGTFIDGQKIQDGFNVEVNPGSIITFSNEEFRLERC